VFQHLLGEGLYLAFLPGSISIGFAFGGDGFRRLGWGLLNQNLLGSQTLLLQLIGYEFLV
jgi:hypothetical protein